MKLFQVDGGITTYFRCKEGDTLTIEFGVPSAASISTKRNETFTWRITNKRREVFQVYSVWIDTELSNAGRVIRLDGTVNGEPAMLSAYQNYRTAIIQTY